MKKSISALKYEFILSNLANYEKFRIFFLLKKAEKNSGKDFDVAKNLKGPEQVKCPVFLFFYVLGFKLSFSFSYKPAFRTCFFILSGIGVNDKNNELAAST